MAKARGMDTATEAFHFLSTRLDQHKNIIQSVICIYIYTIIVATKAPLSNSDSFTWSDGTIQSNVHTDQWQNYMHHFDDIDHLLHDTDPVSMNYSKNVSKWFTITSHYIWSAFSIKVYLSFSKSYVIFGENFISQLVKLR